MIAQPPRPSTPTPKLWTVDEYYRMSEVGILAPDERTELIEGEIILMAAKNPLHVAVGKTAADYLRSLLTGIADIRTQDPVHLSDTSEPEPDIAVVEQDVRNYIDRHPTAEQVFLIIEVADATLAYDLSQKAKLYAQASIVEYWVVDVKKQRVHVFRSIGAGEYQQKSILLSDDSIELLALPGISVSVGEFFPLSNLPPRIADY